MHLASGVIIAAVASASELVETTRGLFLSVSFSTRVGTRAQQLRLELARLSVPGPDRRHCG